MEIFTGPFLFIRRKIIYMGIRLALLFLVFGFFPVFSNTGHRHEVAVATVESKIRALDAQTPMSLVYHRDVQSYIDVYTIRRREHLAAIIGRAELYFPIFEEHLDRLGLPLELKYLAIVESALEPRAKSTSGAMGLWQFLFHAGRLFNLKVTSYVDERCDPVKSTEAACNYLKYLYDNFHDWNLVMAAYNGGIAVVQDAIAKSGGETDFWKIRHHLSKETQNYVPAFIAVNYVMNYYELYGIVPANAPFRYDDLGFVFTDKSISFQQLSQVIDVPLDMLRLLNPAYTRDFIPVLDEPVQIVVPQDKVLLFIQSRNKLRAESAPPVATQRPIGDTFGRERIVHRVRPGEFFHRIAMDYGVRVEDMQKWNNLKTRNLIAGQQLIIWYKKTECPFFFVYKD